MGNESALFVAYSRGIIERKERDERKAMCDGNSMVLCKMECMVSFVRFK